MLRSSATAFPAAWMCAAQDLLVSSNNIHSCPAKITLNTSVTSLDIHLIGKAVGKPLFCFFKKKGIFVKLDCSMFESLASSY